MNGIANKQQISYIMILDVLRRHCFFQSNSLVDITVSLKVVVCDWLLSKSHKLHESGFQFHRFIGTYVQFSIVLEIDDSALQAPNASATTALTTCHYMQHRHATHKAGLRANAQCRAACVM
jgi:hypothetical protein